MPIGQSAWHCMISGRNGLSFCSWRNFQLPWYNQHTERDSVYITIA